MLTKDQADRFERKVARSDGCWEWVGSRTSRGYGKFTINHVDFGAHRIAWSMVHGDIPAGMYICHRCDNPGCVRPEHLFLGTPSENQRDCVDKGRRPLSVICGGGRCNPNAVLTEDQVRAIRTVGRSESFSKTGERFGVSKSAIYNIVSRRTWAHLP